MLRKVKVARIFFLVGVSWLGGTFSPVHLPSLTTFSMACGLLRSHMVSWGPALWNSLPFAFWFQCCSLLLLNSLPASGPILQTLLQPWRWSDTLKEGKMWAGNCDRTKLGHMAHKNQSSSLHQEARHMDLKGFIVSLPVNLGWVPASAETLLWCEASCALRGPCMSRRVKWNNDSGLFSRVLDFRSVEHSLYLPNPTVARFFFLCSQM